MTFSCLIDRRAVVADAGDVDRNVVAAGLGDRAGQQAERDRGGRLGRELAHIVIVVAGDDGDLFGQLQRDLHHVDGVGARGGQNLGGEVKLLARLHLAGAVRGRLDHQGAGFAPLGGGRAHALADGLGQVDQRNLLVFVAQVKAQLGFPRQDM